MQANNHKKIAIVTGANRGIGKETALELARRDMIVIMACRNIARAEQARAEIVAQTHSMDINILRLDLASKRSIRAFVDEFKARFGRLDILVNNAGICEMACTITSDGFESNIGTNFIGTALLTMLLLPAFEKHDGCRIVNVVSNIYRIGQFSAKKLNRYRWFKAYAVSKYLLLLFTLELADRLHDDGITVNAVHPGIVKTSIMYTGMWFDFLIRAILSPFFVDVTKGAATSVYAATAEEAKDITGHYFADSKARRISRLYDTPQRRMAAWEMIQNLIDTI